MMKMLWKNNRISTNTFFFMISLSFLQFISDSPIFFCLNTNIVKKKNMIMQNSLESILLGAPYLINKFLIPSKKNPFKIIF